MSHSILQGYEEFRRFINPLIVARAEISNEPFRFVRAQGGTLWDEDGNAFYDLLSGWGTQGLGHRNPIIAQALTDYLATQEPSFFPSSITPHAGLLAKQLHQRTGYDSAFFASGGTEAVEAALKIARSSTKKTKILYLDGAYHGCTFGSVSMMARGFLRDPFLPLLPMVEELAFNNVSALEAALQDEVAAIVVEPVQMEGGVRELSLEFLQALAVAQERGVLVVADEIQTGLGRCGHFLYSSLWPRRPDIVVLAKSLGGGLVPISAMLTTQEIFQRAYGDFHTAESHNSTFSGNALACVAALSAMDLLTEARFIKAKRAGERLFSGLQRSLSGKSLFKELRGVGLLGGIVLQQPEHPWFSFEHFGASELGAQPSIGLLLCHRLYKRGFISYVCGHDWSVVRLQPPLDIEDADIDRFVGVCAEELDYLENWS
jgi:acetylornithine/succinyldiaminopimelate/putrescine aminotransferase